MDEKVKNAIKFYLIATKLKYKIRSGWDNNHWNISSDRIESVAEHVYGVCILAISLESEFDFDIDLNKVIKMLVLHEIGEANIGDITPFDNVSNKENIEHNAWLSILEDLVKKDEIYELLMEFDERNTKEAKFAYYCDKLEADIQSKVYEDFGYQHSLDDQENNKVMKSDKIKEIINNGAKTAFDVWYEYDKDIYKEEVFKKVLNYVKETDTKKFIK